MFFLDLGAFFWIFYLFVIMPIVILYVYLVVSLIFFNIFFFSFYRKKIVVTLYIKKLSTCYMNEVVTSFYAHFLYYIYNFFK